MATYKLIQNVEAEDHILGPLTLRQFIFGLITVFCLYLSFIFITKHITFLLIFSIPPALFFGMFTIPFGKDQPTEIWFLAKLRFWFKPRRRIWNQSGVKELVTITAPKKVERVLTNGLSAYEVTSRLKVLANTLDSRGWAVKNVSRENSYNYTNSSQDTDRLVPLSSLSSSVPETETDNIDILEPSSPVAYKFEKMIDQSNTQVRENLIQQMNSPEVPETPVNQTSQSEWFMPQSYTKPGPVLATDIPPAAPSDSDISLLDKLKSSQERSSEYTKNMHVYNKSEPEQQYKVASSSSSTSGNTDPVIMSLAKRNDLTIQTIDHVAKKEHESQDEVIIPLH